MKSLLIGHLALCVIVLSVLAGPALAQGDEQPPDEEAGPPGPVQPAGPAPRGGGLDIHSFDMSAFPPQPTNQEEQDVLGLIHSARTPAGKMVAHMKLGLYYSRRGVTGIANAELAKGRAWGEISKSGSGGPPPPPEDSSPEPGPAGPQGQPPQAGPGEAPPGPPPQAGEGGPQPGHPPQTGQGEPPPGNEELFDLSAFPRPPRTAEEKAILKAINTVNDPQAEQAAHRRLASYYRRKGDARRAGEEERRAAALDHPPPAQGQQ